MQQTQPQHPIIKKTSAQKHHFKYTNAEFKNLARQHQVRFIQQMGNAMGLIIWKDEEQKYDILKKEYAWQGLLFYEGFRNDILSLHHSAGSNLSLHLLEHSLRSEHIPYNIFYPMMLKQNKNATKGFFQELLGNKDIADILDVRIEYSPQPKENYIDDHTAFDTFVLYRHTNGSLGGIGIEIKYTEREYTIDAKSKEYRCTHSIDKHSVHLCSAYRRGTDRSNYYLPNVDNMLVSDELRQIWRNHILGGAMVTNGDIQHFSSVTIFPDGNSHFHIAGGHYREVLNDFGKSTFFLITYEKVFEILTHHFRTQEHLDWIEYLYNRYLWETKMPKVQPVKKTITFETGYLSGINAIANNTQKQFRRETFSQEMPTSQKPPLAKTINRGLNNAFISRFKESSLFQFYKKHDKELLLCIRNNYINIYYGLNNIAEVRYVNGELSCSIHPLFIGRSGKNNITLYGNDIQNLIIDRYDTIKELIRSREQKTAEKASQHKLCIQNNASPSSNWFCVDVEWARLFNNQEEKNSANLSSRMDIIAVSKEAPFRVAIIELKYGSGSYSGSAGVGKHIADFRKLKEGFIYKGTKIDYYDGMKTDICNILAAYEELGIAIPNSLKGISAESFADAPEFYIMTMDNNAKSSRGFLPKQTLAAYLFSPNSRNYYAWGCRKPSKVNVQDTMGIDVLNINSPLPVTFVFSKQRINNICITDILEDVSYEIIQPHQPSTIMPPIVNKLSMATAHQPSTTLQKNFNTLSMILTIGALALIILLFWFFFS